MILMGPWTHIHTQTSRINHTNHQYHTSTSRRLAISPAGYTGYGRVGAPSQLQAAGWLFQRAGWLYIASQHLPPAGYVAGWLYWVWTGAG